MRIAILTISDAGARGERADTSGDTIEQWARGRGYELAGRELVPDDTAQIVAVITGWCDRDDVELVLTTGGTGPARRDLTPEATLDVATREMPGFGEQMRQVSLKFVPTAILSRQVAVIRELPDHAALIINLPGQPKAIQETLEGLRGADGGLQVPGIFAAVPYCLDLIGGPYVDTHDEIVKAFRPKSARRG